MQVNWAAQSNRRLRALLWLLAAWAVLIVGRLIQLQVVEHDDLVLLAQHQQQHVIEIPAIRGSILDRTGQPLAKTLRVDSIRIYPKKTGDDPTVTAYVLSHLLDLKYAPLLQKIREAKARNRGFLWIKRNATPDEAARLRSTRFEWIETRKEAMRFYPQGGLAAHVVGTFGMVNADDDQERGNSGVELKLEDELAGRPGKARVFTDSHQRAYKQETLLQPDPGVDVTLTINPNLQFDAQKALDAAAQKSNATAGTLIAIDPYTFEILAMANYPSFNPANVDPDKPDIGSLDLNKTKSIDETAAHRNTAISAPFEPGSVFKIITLSAALDSTDMTPDTTIFCGAGPLLFRGHKFEDHIHGPMTMAKVLEQSSNCGAIQFAARTGEAKFYDYIRRFGFGQRTGIDLPGESAGILQNVKHWQYDAIGSIAIGHEIAATSLQLAMAGAVIANGGIMKKPRLILQRQRPGQQPIVDPADPGVRIIKPETAIKMRAMMEGVVLRGTGRAAGLRGYTAGGKTGSAMIFDAKTKTYVRHYNASFVGFAPVANPQIVIAVTLINTPTGPSGFGGVVAAPVFGEVAASAMRLKEVPKDVDKDIQDKEVSRDTNRDPSKDPDQDTDTNSTPVPAVVASRPAENTAPSSSAGPAVPDYRGLPLRTVLEESAAKGIYVEVAGDGIARTQQPAPGTPLAPGTRIKVGFGK